MKDELNIISALKPLVYDPQKYNALLDYLDMRIQREYKMLESSIDPIQIHRSQGKIQAFKLLKNLREEVLSGDS